MSHSGNTTPVGSLGAFEQAGIGGSAANSEGEFGGRLHVTVVKATNLGCDDITPTCHVTVSLGSNEESTKSISGVTPVFGQSFSLNVTSYLNNVEFRVIKAGVPSAPQMELGRVTIPLSSLHDQKPLDKSCVLERVARGLSNPTIEVQLHYKYVKAWGPIYAGFAALHKRDHAAAQKSLSLALGSFPEDIDLLGARSAAYIGLRQYKEAMLDAAKIKEINPNSPEAFYRLGNVFFCVEEYQKSRVCYENGLRLAPKNSQLLAAQKGLKRTAIKQKVKEAIDKAKVAFNQGDHVAAATLFSAAIQGNPHNHIYYLYRAINAMKLERYTEAREDMRKLLEIQPKWPRQEPRKEGFLRKEGEINPMMNKRYFVLKDYFLFYYKSAKDIMPLGVICLSKIQLARKGKNGRTFHLMIPEGRKYILRADTDTDTSSWLSLLGSLKEVRLPLYQKDTVIIWDSPKHISQVGGDGESNKSEKLSMDLNDVVMSGYLYKRGAIFTDWKLRWFGLCSSGHLFYFGSKQTDPRNVQTPKGHLYIPGNPVKESGKNKDEFVFEIRTPGRTYHLRAETERDRVSWFAAIDKVLLPFRMSRDDDAIDSGLSSGDDSSVSESDGEIQDWERDVEPGPLMTGRDGVEDNTQGSVVDGNTPSNGKDVKGDGTVNSAYKDMMIKRQQGSRSQLDVPNGTGNEGGSSDGGKRHSRILGKQMSSAESRHYLKMGLTPPAAHHPVDDLNDDDMEEMMEGGTARAPRRMDMGSGELQELDIEDEDEESERGPLVHNRSGSGGRGGDRFIDTRESSFSLQTTVHSEHRLSRSEVGTDNDACCDSCTIL
eukprot:TRINITY_DN3160_c0_g1_i1.p1 TRINITY_DN3160_c0_g1~~TRINITY_DN3160_c0_g1_i1.p1  ORF type:complete len:825 (+),score=159.80 TRINITY_DN3160_c0_g1_i1:195-2669(+)